MVVYRGVILLVFLFKISDSADPACVIELECEECVPDNMPLVTSHRAPGGAVTAASGDEVLLSCGGGGKFAAYPLLGALAAVCEAGHYRVRQDGALRHLLELGCQENIFEDVLHEVEQCGSPLQGRAYQAQEAGGGVRHLATLCFDEDRGVAVRARAGSSPRGLRALPPHSDRAGPLSLLGNFNHMFDARTRRDAERLYSDDERLNRRLRELLRHDRVSLAGQSLTAGRLLGAGYFDDQSTRVTDFASNKVAVWRSVAEGNLRHLHRDVAQLMQLSGARGELDVYAGTHGVLGVRAGGGRAAVFLRAGRRFPAPRYVWTAVLARRARRGLALVLLNDPLVAVSEIREAVFCDSACGRVAWLHELRRNRNYESPVHGLVFCCSLHNFTSIVPEMPRDLVRDIIEGNEGMLTESFV